jgi:hypothetical protein
MDATTPILASKYHVINEAPLSDEDKAAILECAKSHTVEDRANVREAFLNDLLQDSQILGIALRRAAGHLTAPVCFAGFPAEVDAVALEAKLREIHNHIANAAWALTEANEIATKGLPE